LDCHEPDSRKPLLSEIQFFEFHFRAAVESRNSLEMINPLNTLQDEIDRCNDSVKGFYYLCVRKGLRLEYLELIIIAGVYSQ